MARSNRPELIKDNPVAPQLYVRWRKKQGSSSVSATTSDEEPLREALRSLAEAAEDFAKVAPQWKRADAERQALLDAITHAQLVLSSEGVPVGKPRRKT